MLAEICKKLIAENVAGAVRFQAMDHIYWLKSSGEEKDNLVRRVSVFLAKYNALSFFDTKAIWSSTERIQHEKKILHYLNEKGFAAPKIEYEGTGFFVTLDEGVPLNIIDHTRINQGIIDDLFTLVHELHSHNIAHGRPTLRDIVLDDDNQLFLLDFEEAIIDPTDQQMARDIFILLMELSDIESINEEQKTQSLLAWKDKTSQQVWEQFLKITRFLQTFVFLAHLVRFFKRRNRLSRQMITTLRMLKKIT